MAAQTLILFLMFELSYEFAGIKFEAIYNRIYRLQFNQYLILRMISSTAH